MLNDKSDIPSCYKFNKKEGKKEKIKTIGIYYVSTMFIVS